MTTALRKHVSNLSGFFKVCDTETDLFWWLFSALVVATAAGGYVMGSGEKIDWAGLGWTSLGTYMAAASANAFNQVRK